MRFRGPSAAVAAFAIAAAMVPGPIAAQDGAPESQSRVPAPEECQIEPRTVDELVPLLEGSDETSDETARLNEIPVPLGVRADAETSDAINRTARELLACINAGDFLRLSALFTESGVAPALGPAPEDPSGFSDAPTPFAPEEQTRLLTVTDASLLEDGRAAAFVVLSDPRTPPGGAETLLLLFAERDDRWLIDRLIDFTVLPRGEAGTPTAEGTPAP